MSEHFWREQSFQRQQDRPKQDYPEFETTISNAIKEKYKKQREIEAALEDLELAYECSEF